MIWSRGWRALVSQWKVSGSIRHDPSGLNGEAQEGKRERQEAVLLEPPSHVDANKEV